MLTALIYLTLALVAASLVVMLVFGLKNASRLLSQSKLGLAAFALPVVLLVIFYALNTGHPEGAWTVAAIWTSLVTAGLGLLALVVSGVRGLVS